MDLDRRFESFITAASLPCNWRILLYVKGGGGLKSVVGLSRSIQLLHLDQSRIPMYRMAASWVGHVSMCLQPHLGGWTIFVRSKDLPKCVWRLTWWRFLQLAFHRPQHQRRLGMAPLSRKRCQKNHPVCHPGHQWGMGPKGECDECTEEEIRKAAEYMLSLVEKRWFSGELNWKKCEQLRLNRD